MKRLQIGKALLLTITTLLIVVVVGKTVWAEKNTSDYDGGPIRVIYDYIGHYALNYTGNTNNYDYWNAAGTGKILSRNYKDRTDLPMATDNNSTANISKTDSKSEMKHAFLVWESRAEASTTEPIILVTPKNGIYEVSADTICKDARTNAAGEAYTGVYTMVVDVTEIVCSSDGGYGTYTVANIPVWEGAKEGVACGGESVASWQLVVVEESPNFPLRTISLNIMSQSFYNIDYTVRVDFADASSPSGIVTAQFLDGKIDVTSDHTYDGTGYEDDHNFVHAGNYFRYFTPTRGLYKNGICINSRDQGESGSYANGGIRVHLFDDLRRENSAGYQEVIYKYAGTGFGACAFLFGVSIDIFAYDIKFDDNGADTGSMENLFCVYSRNYKLPQNQFVKEHYEFAGWNTKADGSGTSYQDMGEVKNLTATEKEVILYAQWKPDAYQIILDNQGAVTSGTTEYFEWYSLGNYSTKDCTEEIEKIVIPEKNGYIFGGYYTEKNGAGTQYVDVDGNILSTATTFIKDTTLYAKWIPAIYKITLDNQDADTAGTEVYYQKFNVGNYASNDCINAISKIVNPTKAQYLFCGYFTEKNGAGQRVVDADGNIAEAYTLFDSDTTIYAYWEPETYIISLDNRDATISGTKAYYEKYGVMNYLVLGVVNPETETVVQQYDYTGSVQTFIAPYSGTYRLDVYGASGENAAPYVGSIHDCTAYGGWVYGSVNLVEGEILYIYVGGEGANKLGGWNGGGEGAAIYTWTSGFVETLGGGGATDIRKGGNSLQDRIIVAGGGAGGWYMTNTTNLERVQGAGNTTYFSPHIAGLSPYNSLKVESANQLNAGKYNKGDLLFTAVHSTDGKTYDATIRRIKKGTFGSGVEGGGGGWYGGGSLMIDAVAREDGYARIFVGGTSSGSSYKGGVTEAHVFYTSTDLAGVYYDENENVVRDENNNYIKATAGNGYAKITYIDYKEISQTPTDSITVPQKDGYIFGGYYTEENGGGRQYVDSRGNILSTPTTFKEDTTLYAYWITSDSNIYTVHFDANGGVGAMEDATFVSGVSQKLPLNTFVKKNEYGASMFLGWNTQADANTILYSDGIEVADIPGGESGSVTLYAIWDDCPWITAENLYYTLEEAQSGFITHDELMSQAIAADMEDGSMIPPGINEDTGTIFRLIDFLPTDFTQFTQEGSVTETYQVIDSVGNEFKKMITVYIVDTTVVEVKADGTTRFINEKYYNESYENGGLEENSIWKTNPEYVAAIQAAFQNRKNGRPIRSFEFTHEEILKMKAFIWINGIGNSKRGDGLQQFYDEFLVSAHTN